MTGSTKNTLRDVAGLLPRLLDEGAAALCPVSRTWPGSVFAYEAARILGARHS